MNKTFSFVLSCIMVVMIFSCKDPERKKTQFPNYLKNTNWIIESGGLIIPDSEKTYYLSRKIDTAAIFNFHAVNFLDEEKFNSYDSWECGNDCFTKVYGRYYFTESNQVEMEIDSISQTGTCQAPVQIFKPAKGIAFHIVKKGKQLQLIRK